jgi:hypothetical protein
MTPNLVLLCGTARSGKSTAAAAFVDAFDAEDQRAAEAPLGVFVKLELSGILGITIEAQEANRVAWRPIWQVWGTEVRRRLFGESYWLRQWEAARNGRKPCHIVVPDVRFANEFEFFSLYAQQHGFRERRLWVKRDSQWEEEQARLAVAAHVSEQDWRSAVGKHTVLYNDGAPRKLKEQCERLVRDWMRE